VKDIEGIDVPDNIVDHAGTLERMSVLPPPESRHRSAEYRFGSTTVRTPSK
jgi:hypothetical protein